MKFTITVPDGEKLNVRVQAKNHPVHDGQGNAVMAWADQRIDTLAADKREYDLPAGQRLIIDGA